MVVRTFTAVLQREEDVYVAECPEVGTVSQGNSVEVAVANVIEATEVCLGEVGRSQVTTFEATYA